MLALPTFLPEVPRVVQLNTSLAATLALAQTLLAEGILQEGDWQGDVTTSLQEGFQRWVREETLCGSLECLRLSLHYSDDPAAFQLDRDLLAQLPSFPKDDVVVGEEVVDVPIGLFAIQASACYSLAFEPVFTALVQVAGAEFAWSVYGVLIEALRASVGCAAADWAHDQVEQWGEWQDEEGEVYDPRDWADQLPHPELTLPKVEPEVLQAMMLREAHAEDSQLWRIASVASRLAKLLKGAPDWVSHLYAWSPPESEWSMGPVAAALVHWQDEDPVVRIWDDYCEMNSQEYGWDHTAWAHVWTDTSPWSLPRAVVALRWVLEVVGLSDQLLGLLHRIGGHQ